jgi:hypothetical protein
MNRMKKENPYYTLLANTHWSENDSKWIKVGRRNYLLEGHRGMVSIWIHNTTLGYNIPYTRVWRWKGAEFESTIPTIKRIILQIV